MKTPEQQEKAAKLAREWSSKQAHNEIESALAFHSFMEGHDIGYRTAKEEEATKDQKIAELWTESIRRMLPSVHEITLFPSKRSEDK